MKRQKYLFLGCGFAILFIVTTIYLIKPNQSYIEHSTYIANLDAAYGITENIHDAKNLLKQRLTLLPHLRRRYSHFSYSVPNDLHVRTALLQQESNSLAQLRADAVLTQDRLTKFLTDFATRFEGSHLYIPKTKRLKTINNLLVTRWDGDASRITDYSRATISFPTIEMMYQGLAELKKTSLIILDITDNFDSPCLGGYRDITVVFRDFTNGHLGEIQLNTNKIMEFKNSLGTELFHVIRELIAIPKLENRGLTENEQICLDKLFEIERLGYDSALEGSRKSSGNEVAQKMVGVYSGSFDPPTKAHREIIISAAEKSNCDKLILYVNALGRKTYHADAEERKKMLELMFKDHADRISIYIQTNGDKRVDYRKIRGIDNQLMLIMGEDSYFKRLSLPKIQVIACDKILVIPREADSHTLLSKLGPDAELMPTTKTHNISSTLVRTQLAHGELSEIELDADVLNYILSKRLYSAVKPDDMASRL